jgi:deoxyribodipyrimidine photo-lyase
LIKSILDKLNDKSDKRVNFIHEQLFELKLDYNNLGTDLIVEYGDVLEVWQWLVKNL